MSPTKPKRSPLEHDVAEFLARTCAAPDCTRPVLARGLCRAHYDQQRAGRPLAPVGAPGGRLGEVALVHLQAKVPPADVAELDAVQGRSARAATLRLVIGAWALRQRMEREAELLADPDPEPGCTCHLEQGDSACSVHGEDSGGVAGDHCGPGNECGRLGCEECQPAGWERS